MGTEPSSIQRGTKGARKGRIGRGVLVAIIAIVIAVAAGGTAYVLFFRPPDVVQVAGSSTVFPITSAWAERFNAQSRQVVVAGGGTGAGFDKFCRGEIDLADASRPIRAADSDPATTTETERCTAAGITQIVQFKVAYDGLTIVVNEANTDVKNLTVKQLCRIWTSNTSSGACGGSGGRVTHWNQLNATWDAQPISRWGPGADSGTFDYFIEVILSNRRTEHTDVYNASEVDEDLVAGVSQNLYAVGYFGYAYYVENQNILNAVAIDDENAANGAGPILPTEASIKGETYKPLGRPLYVYGYTGVAAKSLDRPVVRDYLRFGLSADPGMVLVTQTGYVSLSDAEIATERSKIPA